MHPEIIFIKSTIVSSSTQEKRKLLLAKKIIIYHMVHINSRGKKTNHEHVLM